MSLQLTWKTVAVLLFLGFSSTSLADPNCSNVPDGMDSVVTFRFKEACFKHDVCYSEAPLTGFTKKQCDDFFYKNMKASCRGFNVTCEASAWVYYKFVQNLADKVFLDANKKGHMVAEAIEAANDKGAMKEVNARAANQKAWIKKNAECADISDKAKFKACDEQLKLIKVANIPFAYPLGKCDIFGIDWVDGSRTANQKKMSRITGVPLSDITGKGDPCAGLYP